MDISTLPDYRRALGEIQTAWDNVLRSGTLRVVVLEGESGANKTDVIEMFIKMSQPPTVRSHGVEIPEPYLPLRIAFESMLRLEIVQEQLRQSPEKVSPDWEITLTTLAQLLPLLALTPTPTVEALANWQPAFRAHVVSSSSEENEPLHPVTLSGLFTLALGEMAARKPLLFLVDDVDLADDATVEALTLDILPALTDSAVLFICAMEPKVKPATALSQFTRWIESTPSSQRLTLSPLSVIDISTILCNETTGLAGKQLEKVAARIHRATGGNLAGVRNMVHWIKRTSEDALTIIDAGLDRTVVLQERFAQLSQLERTVLQMASVQGTMFCAQAVTLATDKQSIEIEAVLNQIVQTKQYVFFDADAALNETTLHWYRFRGRYVRDWIYSTIPQEQLAMYHQKIGLALEALYSDARVSIAGVLAQQFKLGKLFDRAVRYYALVARQANEQGAMDQALEYAQNGLDMCENTQENLMFRCDLLLQKGRALMNSEKAHLAEDSLRETIEKAQEFEIPQLEMESLYYLGELLLNRNVWDEGMELVRQAMELAVERKAWSIIVAGMEKLRGYYSSQDPETFLTLCDRIITSITLNPSPEAKFAIAEILEDKAWLFYQKRQHPETMTALQQALASLCSADSLSQFPETRFKIYQRLARSFCATQSYQESLNEAEHALAWAKASHNRANIAKAHDTKAFVLRQMGRISEGEKEYEMALDLLKNSSDLMTLGSIAGNYGHFLSLSGRKRHAREFYMRSYSYRQAGNYLRALQISQNNLAAVDKHLGLFQSALTIYEQLYNEGTAQNDKSRQSLSLNHIGDINRILGRLDESRRAHEEALRICEAIGGQGRKAITLRYLGRAFLCGWQLDRARKHLEEADEMNWDNKVITRNRHLYNQIYLGRLSLCEGNLSDSNEQLNAAIESLQVLEDQSWVGIGYLNLGLLFFEQGELTDGVSMTQKALETLNASESWRTVEAHHLLGRYYIATGDLSEAEREIEKAKTGFMDLGLSHRVFQVENTELYIQEARKARDYTKWQCLLSSELQYDFNHLGI